MMIDPSPTKGEYGLRALSQPDQAIVDIVFVHGLSGNRETTWTHKKSKIFWPETLLPIDLPCARILTFGYDADVVRALDTAGSETLRDHGKALANDLALRRMKTRTNHRPLIFVAHSLGGLVVEQALLISRGAAQEHLKDLLESTYAIMFIGTPHMGSNKADWAAPLTRLSKVFRTTNSKIVQVLQPGSEMLANLQQEFHTLLDDRSKNQGRWVEIYCFYETVPVVGIGEIVPSHSAILSAYPNSGIHGNHMDMTRFSGPTDNGYVRVSEQLWLWVDTIERTLQSSAPAPSELREKRNKKFGSMQDIDPQPERAGFFHSGGGPIIFGSQSAGRDISYRTA